MLISIHLDCPVILSWIALNFIRKTRSITPCLAHLIKLISKVIPLIFPAFKFVTVIKWFKLDPWFHRVKEF